MLADPLEVAQAIPAESMIPLDDRAFEKARVEFGRAYAHAFAAHPSFDRGVEAQDEALCEALQACIGTYLRGGRAVSNHKNLAEALAAFQAEDGLTFQKTKTAKVKSQRTGGEYSYKYADLGDILPVVRPLLAKHGLSWSAKPSMAGDTLTLAYRLLHASGEADDGEMPLGVDKGCKPQELGSAITYARRYALTAQLNLATDEDDDGGAAQQAERSRARQGTNGDVVFATAGDIEHIKAAAKGLPVGKIKLAFTSVGLPVPDADVAHLFDRVPKAKALILAEALSGVER